MKYVKKVLAFLTVVTLTAAVAVGGTLAYLTDRDSEANVFTVGNVDIELNEEFDQASALIPGVEIEKIPTITNTGTNDAWVWLTFSVPTALDNWNPASEAGSNNNVIHWNPLGATTFGAAEYAAQGQSYHYVTESRVNQAIAGGYLPAGSTAEAILASGQTWNVFNNFVNGGNAYKETINDVEYTTYVIPYNKVLEPNETTLPTVTKVFLDARVDIDPDGNWNFVENGVVTALNWNSTDDGEPIIYVSAYAMQEEGFANVKEAYEAYQEQWGTQGNEYAEPAAVVYTVDDMREAMKKEGANIILGSDLKVTDDKGTGYCFYAKYDCQIDLNGHDIEVDLSGKGFYGVVYALNGAQVDIVGEGEITVSGGVGQWVWCTGANGDTAINIYGGNWKEASNDFDTDYCEGLYANREGIVNIYGGTFDWSSYPQYTANESREGIVNIYGGTFINFDPRVSHDSDGSYVAEGYKVVSETQANGDIWYTVVPE